MSLLKLVVIVFINQLLRFYFIPLSLVRQRNQSSTDPISHE